MALKLPDHSHCESCGDPIPFGETHCSEECRASAANEKAKDKRMEYITYVSIGAALIALVLIGYFV